VANGLEVPGLPPHFLGYVNLLQWALLAGTSISIAWAGVRVAHRLSPDRLKLVFAVVMLYIALKMMASSGLLPFDHSIPLRV